jgi:hypothetical protein
VKGTISGAVALLLLFGSYVRAQTGTATFSADVARKAVALSSVTNMIFVPGNQACPADWSVVGDPRKGEFCVSMNAITIPEMTDSIEEQGWKLGCPVNQLKSMDRTGVATDKREVTMAANPTIVDRRLTPDVEQTPPETAELKLARLLRQIDALLCKAFGGDAETIANSLRGL